MLVGAAIAGAIGLVSSAVTNTRERRAAEAAAAEAAADAAELRTQAAAEFGMNLRRMQNMQTSRMNMLAQGQRQYDEAAIQGKRRVGSETAMQGASGFNLTGSKAGVIDQVKGDVDRQLNDISSRIHEANIEALDAIELTRMQGEENVRRINRGAAVLELESYNLEQESRFSIEDVVDIALGGANAAVGGANMGLNYYSATTTPAVTTPDVNLATGTSGWQATTDFLINDYLRNR